jgi:hypothetical protein
MPRTIRTLLGDINRKYVYNSNNVTTAYEKRYGLYCDLYFPVHNQAPQNPTQEGQPYYRNSALPQKSGEFDMVNIFEPHEQPAYRNIPDVSKAKFYIPYLLKKENMNSPDLEFDSIFLGDYEKRPFIETTKKRELPIGTKVVVYIDFSKMYFWVDKKTVVNGANGHMLLRMYLSPLLEQDDDGDLSMETENY